MKNFHDHHMTRFRRVRDTSGFALPAAIFALVVVGMLVTAGIHVATQESRIGQATEQAV